MGYTPLARWRNFTLDNLKTILKIYPDMIYDMPRSEAIDQIEEKLRGYKRTAYQHACQLGLECRGEKFKVQNYLYSFDDENLERYLHFWFKMYVAPNPYVKSEDPPISIFVAIANELLNSESNRMHFEDFSSKYFGDGKSSDILKNAIQAYGYPISLNENDELYIIENNIDELNRIIKKVNSTLPMENNMDEKEFFERFSYENFCAYYDIPKVTIQEIQEVHEAKRDYVDRVKGGNNVLLYGVPGSGKSYKIEKEYCNDFNFMERVVFHPDYMNTDFVGQILPTVKGEGDDKEITYDFTPGPFTRVLKKAIENPRDHYYLVIEEINRGNAPAIFGEIFQLLDRDDVGKSSYEITNYNIANEVFNQKEKPIYLPSNLHILATMNTADQNVFTLDTAFQRRWDMKMIENDVAKAEHASKSILDTSVTWERFNTVINDQIITSSAATLSSEDKRLGAYFVTEEILKYYNKEENHDYVVQKYGIKSSDIAKTIKDLNSRFGDKVIKYLWDDAFKFNRDELFDDEYKSLEKVLDTFNNSIGEERFNVFNQDIKENLFRTLDARDSEDE
ncbi:AAA family ATPase [Heyndrickxia sporothermodurans]|uniref:AAA family ATPase n=1 Tax=Heyndrickxia sporothermodurans TaxID=46224 RepID=UPI002E23D2E7|nr:AAA family ATPase [Heyndrickxia sporothermodurans]MED3654699.1 AAA family ATPase [Heyndrickxia sporothermodurans]